MLRDAARKPKARVELVFQGGEVTVTVPDSVQGEVWLAITEDGLATEVRRGENGGRTLRHDAVARRLVKLGRGNRFTHVLKTDDKWRAESLRAAVFVTGADGGVLAAGVLRLR